MALPQAVARQGPHTPLLVAEVDNASHSARLEWRYAVGNANGCVLKPDIDDSNAALTCKTLISKGGLKTVNKASGARAGPSDGAAPTVTEWA